MQFQRFSRSPLPSQVTILAAIDQTQLTTHGIQGIILDLDNTIVSEDDRYLSPGAEDWIRQAKQHGLKLFILSNGKRRHRVEFWSDRLAIAALSPAKKPLPTGFRKALITMELKPSQVVVIGDSRHTDRLGAWIVGCPSIQVASLPHPARWWERILGKWVQIPYPPNFELWHFEPNHY